MGSCWTSYEFARPGLLSCTARMATSRPYSQETNIFPQLLNSNSQSFTGNSQLFAQAVSFPGKLLYFGNVRYSAEIPLLSAVFFQILYDYLPKNATLLVLSPAQAAFSSSIFFPIFSFHKLS